MNFLSKVLFIPETPQKRVPVKALTFVNKDTPPSFTYSNINSPIPASQILIRIYAAALNPLDLQLMNSFLPGQKTVGHDFSGVIEEVGANHVSKWQVGDRVCGMMSNLIGQGTVSTYITINPNSTNIIKIPPNLSNEEAAAFPLSFGTAYTCLKHAKLSPDSWVLILGGNTASGQYAIQIAKNYYNVEKVIVTASSHSVEFLQSLGADIVVNYQAHDDLGEALKSVIREEHPSSISGDFTYDSAATHKFQIIFDCVGGTEVLNKATDLLNPKSSGSAYVTIVGDTHTTPSQLGGSGSYFYNPAMIGRKFLSATGINGLNYIVETIVPGDWLDIAYDMILERTVKVTMDSIYEFDEYKKALEKLKSRKVRGKVVLHISN